MASNNHNSRLNKSVALVIDDYVSYKRQKTKKVEIGYRAG